MIISHRHRFIFVKTRKTAGTSIERFLSAHLGPDDVIMGAGERNHLGRWNPTAELVGHPDPSNVKLTLKQWRQRHRYYQHMPAWRIRGPSRPGRVGRLLHLLLRARPVGQAGVVLLVAHPRRPRGRTSRPGSAPRPDLSAWPLYTIGDRVAVDFIGRYETLEADLATVLDRIGLDAPVELPRDKSGYREPGVVTFTPALDEWVTTTSAARSRCSATTADWTADPTTRGRRAGDGARSARGDVDDDLAHVLVGLHGPVGVGDALPGGSAGRSPGAGRRGRSGAGSRPRSAG